SLLVVLRRKGRILDAMADSLAALRRTLTPGDQALLDQLASAYSHLATQVSRGPGNASAEQYRRSLVALQEERQRRESELGERSAVFRAERGSVTLPEVQSAIPEGAALVEIARYLPFDARVALPIGWGGWGDERERYVAYVLRRRGEPAFADLGSAAS